MVKAFVMVNVKVGTDVEVARQLRKVPNVIAVYDVYGTYDLIAELEAPTLAELYATLSSGVRSLENIVSTHTLMSVR
jgi:DNA-binding Lrp family transcriptional regulator